MNHKRKRSLDVLIVGENPTVTIQAKVALTTIQAPRLPSHPILDRANALATLHSFAHKGRCIAVYGPPAMGKTVLASLFCWHSERHFNKGIIWARLGPQATTESTFQ